MAEALHYPDSDFSSEEDDLPLEEAFFKAANHLRKITGDLSNDQLVELYGLYKQSTEGKCNALKPGFFDARNRRKWDAWNALGNMKKTDAMQKYIKLIEGYDSEFDWRTPSRYQREMWAAVSHHLQQPEPDLDRNNLSILDLAKEDLGNRIAQLLSKQPELKDERDPNGLTALHWAADRNAIKALDAALAGGCEIDAMDESGQTALHYAASCGHIESTKILLDAGASLLPDEEGNTPLDLATENEIIEILEEYSKKSN